ncbi:MULTISPECIES: branched-chain amino acid ABC transporter permease [Enterococcaceae]|uniref:branched-chain amino acid ABC transporter permease n=1 Tax=Enterococcaceae TaxID=81852 RepID=UPI000E54B7B4|nr:MULTISPECIES: branched-chain amino acid ABC transporter permease [Enterococcaceae]RGI31744.1 branched-chain amino acid ABC transporter permease [Melissococcus sp. OM08-11BH]UNM90224.1 branched-chain amino acid ABC transporter permease [Vagococcus sp. CY52-2]
MNVLQQLVNGLSLGSIYALLALGYTMVYGIIKLINFAHGEIYMIGAFIGYYVANNFGFGLVLTLLTSMIICAILGMLIEFLAYRPLRNSTRIAALITAIGVSFLLQSLMIYFVGADTKPYPQLMKNITYDLGICQISKIQLVIIATSIFLMLLLQFIVQQTKMGRAMRAASVDPEAAQLMGINVNYTISFTFALGSSLAAAGGVLIGLYYNSIDPMMGVAPGLKAFIAAVFGGIGIIPGAALGGFAIGIIETVVSALGFTAYRDAAVYLILIIVLLVKPSGLLGKNIKEKV